MPDHSKGKKFSSETVQKASLMRNPARPGPGLHWELNGYEIRPYYLNASLVASPGSVGEGSIVENYWKENAIPKYNMKGFPHRHDREESFFFFSIDPEDPDNLGGTHEFWIGDGEDAEAYVLTKPTFILVPRNTTHMPFVTREVHRPFMQIMIFDSALYPYFQVPRLPPGFSLDNPPGERNSKARKYQKYVMERDVSKAPYYPSHKDKAQVMMHFDMQDNEEAPHYIEINLIYGSGIGWGCGDIVQYPEWDIRSLPHIHDVRETYIFQGTDRDNPHDLGGTIEFWIGEGEDAKEYIIDKPTVVLIPPNTVHLPLYVREVHKPFVSAAFLDRPLWACYYTEKFPSGFEHISVP